MILKSRTSVPMHTSEARHRDEFRSMRGRRWSLGILAGCLAALLALTGCSTIHDRHSSDSEHHSNTDEHNEHSDRDALLLKDGTKWSTDEPLRMSMQTINELMIPVHATAPDHLVNSEQGKAIALKVQQQVDFMIANCELEPKADAALHVLIGDLLIGANELKVPETSPSGVSRIGQVLEQYPQHFEHPGWPTSAESGS